MSYEAIAHFAQTWGLGLLVVLFLAAIGYALWPNNRERFRQAARRSLLED